MLSFGCRWLQFVLAWERYHALEQDTNLQKRQTSIHSLHDSLQKIKLPVEAQTFDSGKESNVWYVQDIGF